ncbi:MAG: hypothetical protein PWP65_1739 [Clostridia bacterium]|nr:hypothetical protein [Clostridia bacterium]
MTRILQVVRRIAGGVRGHVATILRHLTNEEFEFSVACPPQDGLLAYFTATGAKVFPVNLGEERNPWRDWQAVREISHIIRNEGIDLIHAHGTRAGTVSAIASRLAGVPCLITHHNFRYAPLKPPLRPLLAACFRPVNRAARRFIAVSHALARELQYYEGIRPERVHVIPNGINWREFDLPAPFFKKEPVLGVVARLIPSKGIAYFLRSAAAVHRLCPEARFLIIGDGPQRPFLENMARSLGLNGVLKFTGWCADIRSALAGIDLVVVPSLYEGFGITVLEAMAAARPVIAFTGGGPEEIILHGETGFLVERGNCQALASAALELLSDHKKARAMGYAGRRRVAEHFNLEKMLQETVKVYRECLENREEIFPCFQESC